MVWHSLVTLPVSRALTGRTSGPAGGARDGGRGASGRTFGGNARPAAATRRFGLERATDDCLTHAALRCFSASSSHEPLRCQTAPPPAPHPHPKHPLGIPEQSPEEQCPRSHRRWTVAVRHELAAPAVGLLLRPEEHAIDGSQATASLRF